MTKIQLYNKYSFKFFEILSAAIELFDGQQSTIPIPFSSFTRSRKKGRRMLKVIKGCSELFDLCKKLKHNIYLLNESNGRHRFLLDLLSKHREDGKKEHAHYKNFLEHFKVKHIGGVQHVIFEFAEIILLPRLVKQPEQLYFITGLKFFFFGVRNTNQGTTIVHGLPEGHWMNEKRANTVLSMLHHGIYSEMVPLHLEGRLRSYSCMQIIAVGKIRTSL